jgi:hypothetical protein
MPNSVQPPPLLSLDPDCAILNPGEIIEAMIDLRIQLAQIEQQI